MDSVFLIYLNILLISAGLTLVWRKRVLTLLLCCFGLSVAIGVGIQIVINPPNEGHAPIEYFLDMLVDASFLFPLTTWLISLWLGFLWRKGVLTLGLCCLGGTFAIGVVMQMKASPPHGGQVSLRYLETMLFWFWPYYLVFFLFPSVAGATIGVLARAVSKGHSGHRSGGDEGEGS